MSKNSKFKRSRNIWKYKAGQRAKEIRYHRKELNRVKKERDRYKKELKDANARLRHLENQPHGLVVWHKVDVVFLSLQLFLVARIGFRAVSRVLAVLAPALGIPKVPCVQTAINWVTRLALVRIQSTATLKGRMQHASCNGLIWMIDMSIALGTGKILTVLALDAHHHQFVPDAPGFQNVHCIAVSVSDSWTGELIASFLERLITVMGRPAAYLKDGGTDLQKAIRLLVERSIGSPSIDDISHVIANLLKGWYAGPKLDFFLMVCGRVSGKLKQTILACLAPPKVQTKARFMNLQRLVTWADLLLKLSPRGAAAKYSALSKLRACMDNLPSCKAFIKQFLGDALPLLECQKILKTKGLSHSTLAQCEPFVQSIPSTGVQRDFSAYLQKQLHIATQLGLEKIGMPVSSDQIESLYGLGKQHGAGEIKDADRIAIRLPTFCGIPTRVEAEQVLKIKVADQKKITDSFTSLIKQRRAVLPNPDRLESLAILQSKAHVELIPSPKNWPKNEETAVCSMNYQILNGPIYESQNGCNSP